ncbi:MAG: Mannuronan C5-epimerase AlgE5 [Pseudomonadales bacterium]|nr:Mannuronan C5-epimerase AlgE5 [Pseudomonadales bacterium]
MRWLPGGHLSFVAAWSLVGTGGDDTLVGGAGGDTLDGGAGNDSLMGLTGADLLRGGVGGDTLAGRADADTLYGGDGNDILYGGGGADLLHGDAGANEVRGDAGNDTVYAGAGGDSLYGDAGVDLLVIDWQASAQHLVLRAGAMAPLADGTLVAGFERLQAKGSGEAANLLVGGAWADTLLGGNGADTLDGGGGNDSLHGAAGRDHLMGGAGNDRLATWYGPGSDTIDGGAGNDLLYLNCSRSLYGIELDLLSLAQGETTLPDGTVLRSIEQLEFFGSDFADVLRAGTGPEYLYLGAGDDSVHAGAGNDTVNGSTGDDSLFGGNGDDWVFGDEGANTLAGGRGADSLYGHGALDRLFGGDGDDQLIASNGFRVIDGGAGTDLAIILGEKYPQGIAFAVADVLDGGAVFGRSIVRNIERVVVYGSDIGADTLEGGELSDGLGGLGGDDSLAGGAGPDWLEAGDGHDTLIGGSGADWFVFATAPGVANVAFIPDFVSDEDLLVLNEWYFPALREHPPGTLDPAHFHAADGATAAHDADDRIVYDSAAGILYYDPDGIGGVAAEPFAILGVDTHPVLSATDFRFGSEFPL